MSSYNFTATDVANFLQDNPDFFTQNAKVFADLRVPHPHQRQAISLGERQILTLRSRLSDLEWQLSGLIHNATGNERISNLLINWCASLLAENDVNNLPNLITQGLEKVFDIPNVSLILWDSPNTETKTNDSNSPYQAVSDDIKKLVDENDAPLCGPVTISPEMAKLLPENMVCMAVLPLKIESSTQSIGVLILSSDDETRFTSDMGTDFLQSIASLTSAAVTRLGNTDNPQTA